MLLGDFCLCVCVCVRISVCEDIHLLFSSKLTVRFVPGTNLVACKVGNNGKIKPIVQMFLGDNTTMESIKGKQLWDEYLKIVH